MQEQLKIKIKKLSEDAIIPSYAKEGDTGLDLTAISRKLVVEEGKADYIEYGTGLSIEIPFGYTGLLFPRSSISGVDIILANCVGVVDAGYRNEIKLRYKINGTYDEVEDMEGNEVILADYDSFNTLEEKYIHYCYEVGDRVAQLVILPFPHITFDEVEELTQTERNQGGFGSTNL